MLVAVGYGTLNQSRITPNVRLSDESGARRHRCGMKNSVALRGST